MSILKSMVKPTSTVATPQPSFQPVEDSYNNSTMQIAENKWIRACIDDLENPSFFNIRRDGNDRVLSWEFECEDDDYSYNDCTVDFMNGHPALNCGLLSYDELLSYKDGGVYYVHLKEPEDQLILAVDRHSDLLSIADTVNGERIGLLNLDNPSALDALIRVLMVIRSTI
jgi:hypothetical protein